MPRRLKLESHLSEEELWLRYRKAPNPIERTRWQILALVARGELTRRVA